MKIAVDHLTEYRYERPVGFGEHSLYLRPRESQTVHVASFSLVCSPEARVRWMRDCFNNVVAVAGFGIAEASLLSFHCRMTFDVVEENPFDFILEPRAHEFPFRYDEREKSALRPYLEPEESERWKILDWVRGTLGLSAQSRDTISFLTDLNQRDSSEHRLPASRRGRDSERERNTRAWQRILPGYGRTAGGDEPAARSRGALRERICV